MCFVFAHTGLSVSVERSKVRVYAFVNDTNLFVKNNSFYLIVKSSYKRISIASIHIWKYNGSDNNIGPKGPLQVKRIFCFLEPLQA